MTHQRRWQFAVCALFLGVTGGAGSAWGQFPSDFGSYRTAGDFELRDVRSGRIVKLSDSFNPEKPTKDVVVLAFTGVSNPADEQALSRLGQLAETYKGKGITFLAINSNAHDTTEQVAEHAQRLGVSFPVLKDPRNVLADLDLIERTGEVLVIAGMREIRYRGAIDDQVGLGASEDAPTRRYLADALDAVLAGRKVATPVTKAVGSPLDRVRPEVVTKSTPRVRAVAEEIAAAHDERASKDATEVGAVTYASAVAKILQEKCQSCHRPGQVGPFSLLTYDDASRHAAMIREVVDDRRMPPWHADPRHGHFENDRSLTGRQRAELMAWVDQGCPLGDAKALPAARTFPEGWTIGKPDLVIEMPESYSVPAQGAVPYQYFRVPSGFTEDKWIQAAEARPGDPSVVHHVLVGIDDHQTKSEEDQRRLPASHLVAYAPGDLPLVLPAGTAKRIPAGADFMIQMHYTPVGTVRADRSSIALIFADGPPRREAHTLGILEPALEIPPGADNHAVRSSYVFEADGELYSLMPHMHLRGKSFRYTATFPDGHSEVLLSVPGYDFAWQSVYRLAKPRHLPKGTRIDCLAHFDNSSKNPANPDPTKKVIWGEQTFEEMMIGYIDVAFLDKTPEISGRPKTSTIGVPKAP